MSVVTIQLGQCGNQIGQQLFNTICDDADAKQTGLSPKANEEYREIVRERFFTRKEVYKNEKLYARAVMVDMESKAISQATKLAKKSGKFVYSSSQQYSEKTGSGNNWAHGFCKHGIKVREPVMNVIRKEVEKCDMFGGFLCLMSLAGGTGSGLGTFVTQCLRDEFPRSFIMNQVVWPYRTGEVIVQNYNAVLTLSHLYQTSDALLVLENDNLHKICSRLLDISKISLSDLNKVATHKLAGVLLPALNSQTSATNHLGSLLEQLVAHPEYKLLTIRNIPQMSERSLEFSTYQWPGLLKHLRQMIVANAAMEEGIDWNVTVGESCDGPPQYNRCIASLLILRGKHVADANTTAFSDPKLYTPWMPRALTLSQWTQPRTFNQYEKSAFLISNSMSPVVSLNHVLSRAWSMFSSRAFISQYSKHGLTEEDFLDSFVTLEQVIHNYSTL